MEATVCAKVLAGDATANVGVPEVQPQGSRKRKAQPEHVMDDDGDTRVRLANEAEGPVATQMSMMVSDDQDLAEAIRLSLSVEPLPQAAPASGDTPTVERMDVSCCHQVVPLERPPVCQQGNNDVEPQAAQEHDAGNLPANQEAVVAAQPAQQGNNDVEPQAAQAHEAGSLPANQEALVVAPPAVAPPADMGQGGERRDFNNDSRKARQSRKSAAYHAAKRAARNAGLPLEEQTRLARAVPCHIIAIP